MQRKTFFHFFAVLSAAPFLGESMFFFLYSAQEIVSYYTLFNLAHNFNLLQHFFHSVNARLFKY